jgi:hypothetical protein
MEKGREKMKTNETGIALDINFNVVNILLNSLHVKS